MPEFFLPFPDEAAFLAWRAGRLPGIADAVRVMAARDGVADPLDGTVGAAGPDPLRGAPRRALQMALRIALRRQGWAHRQDLRLIARTDPAPALHRLGLLSAHGALHPPGRADVLIGDAPGWEEALPALRPGGIVIAPLSASPGAGAWALLARLRAAGFADASLVLVASARHAVAGDAEGLMPLVLATQGVGNAPFPAIAAPAGLPGRLVTLAALPRSGTTLLTALFQVHSRVDALFEPWNGRVLDGPQDATLPRLLAASGIPPDAGRCLFVKETAANLDYAGHLRLLLDRSPLPLERTALVLLRRPAHTFLSEVERRGQWWGDKVPLDARQFGLWCDKYRQALATLIGLLRDHDGALLGFEALAASPATLLPRLAELIGLPVERAQLHYERHLDLRQVRGDMNVQRDPTPISDASVRRRAESEPLVGRLAAGSPHAAWFEAFTALHAAVVQAGLVRLRALPAALLDPLA